MKFITAFLFCFPLFAQSNALQLCDQQSTKHCFTIKAPTTLPANVICELGSTNFGVCAAAGVSATRGGTVIVYPPLAYGGNFIPVAPNGTFISCTGTTTGCLQEAETYSYTYGTNLHVLAGQELTNCTSGSPGPTCGPIGTAFTSGAILQIHPMQGRQIVIDPISLGCNSTNACIQFDSVDMGEFTLGGQVGNSGTGGCFLFYPHSALPDDGGGAGGVINHVHLGTCWTATSTSPLVEFDTSVTGIGASQFTFDELNGGSGGAIKIGNPGSGLSFSGNKVTASVIHLGSGTAPEVAIGTGTLSNPFLIGNNVFDIAAGSANTGHGIDVWGASNEIHAYVGSGTNDYAVYFESGACGNVVIPRQLAGSTGATGGPGLSCNTVLDGSSGGGVAGANTQIQVNIAGVLGASSDFTWNNTTKALAVNGTLDVASTHLYLTGASNTELMTSNTGSGGPVTGGIQALTGSSVRVGSVTAHDTVIVYNNVPGITLGASSLATFAGDVAMNGALNVSNTHLYLTSASNTELMTSNTGSGTVTGGIQALTGSSVRVGSTTAHDTVLVYNNTPGITLGASSLATFAGDVNLGSGSFKIGGTTAIDSSRNGSFVGLTASGALTADSTSVTTSSYAANMTAGSGGSTDGMFLSNAIGTMWAFKTSNGNFEVQANGTLGTLGPISAAGQIASSNTATSFLGYGSMSLAGNVDLTGGSSAYKIGGTTVIGSSRDAHFASGQVSGTASGQLFYVVNSGTGYGILDASPYGSSFAGLIVGPYPFQLTGGAHIYSSGGTTPTISGTGCSLSSGATDVRGEFTCGSTFPITATITFGRAYIQTPMCFISQFSTITSTLVSTSASTLVISDAGPGAVNYFCIM